MRGPSQKVFCAFCRLSRRVYGQKHLSWPNVLLSLLAAALLMFVIWHEFDPRVMVIFVVCLAIAEIFVQIRWRLSVVCPHCGFDPVIYVRDPSAACEKVKYVLKNRKESGEYLLSSNNPFENLPKIKKTSAPQKGASLSRHI